MGGVGWTLRRRRGRLFRRRSVVGLRWARLHSLAVRIRAVLIAVLVALAAWLCPDLVLARPGFAAGRFAAIAMDADSGKVVYARNADARRYPASLTKVMTLYLAFDELDRGRLHLTDRIRMSPHAAAQAPTRLGLAAGKTISVKQALEIIVVKSANDVAVALAEHIGGTEAGFVARMNRKAKALGLSRTHFANASGLPNTHNISTARDLARLGQAILKAHRDRYGLFHLRSTTFNGHRILGHNRMLRLPGVDGIKTGFVGASGFNIMTSAVRGKRRAIIVVLGGNSAAIRDRFAADLLETSFRRLLRSQKTQVAHADAPARPDTRRPAQSWVQVGAYRSRAQALARLTAVTAKHPRHFDSSARWLAEAEGLYRARFDMESAEAAQEACHLLEAEGEDCFTVSTGQRAAGGSGRSDVG
jgi:D-alanyl-D-alanine carboxypeptidase (penicillin-binding protein 5/6)